VGPRGDGYVGGALSVLAAREYHRPQLEALAEARVDLVVALTMTSVAEAVGIVEVASEVGLPVLVSPTIETDGRVPDGVSLGDFVQEVDEATSGLAVGYIANCAHPSHLEPTLRAAGERGEPWLARFRGLRANASTKSHAEIDQSLVLDRGDPQELGRQMGEMCWAHGFTIVGGCCGTDAEHLHAIAAACA
jgi:homocysteine S-methyltransferase